MCSPPTSGPPVLLTGSAHCQGCDSQKVQKQEKWAEGLCGGNIDFKYTNYPPSAFDRRSWILILIRGHPELLIIVGISQIAPHFTLGKLNNQQVPVIIKHSVYRSGDENKSRTIWKFAICSVHSEVIRNVMPRRGVQDDDRRELIHYSFPLCGVVLILLDLP